jgi:hypothetical protein
MAIISVHETFAGAAALESETVQTEYDRTFDVLVDSLQDTRDAALAGVDPRTGLLIPANGSLWLPNPTVPRVAQCKSREARRHPSNLYQWQVTLHYTTEWERETIRVGKIDFASGGYLICPRS